MHNNKTVQYISVRHQRLYNKSETVNTEHNIIAEALKGSNESTGFIEGHNKKTLPFEETLSVTCATHKRQQVDRQSQCGNGYYITLLNTELQDR